MLSTAFTLLGTAVTWLELLAFVLAIANIICNVREVHWAWPLTFVASLLYAWLFYASKLYGDSGVNIFFALSALWGWWQWMFAMRNDGGGGVAKPLRIELLGAKGIAPTVLAWLVLWIATAFLLGKFTDSDVAFADGFVTAGSVVGTVLLGRKFIENWPVWCLVNAASVALFIYKNLILTAILYSLFFAMAIWGWRVWSKRLVLRTANTQP
jgi:nicotinamide mononucleotide transporter